MLFALTQLERRYVDLVCTNLVKLQLSKPAQVTNSTALDGCLKSALVIIDDRQNPPAMKCDTTNANDLESDKLPATWLLP